MLFQEKYLIPNRIPKEQVILGRAYIIHARNGGVGIARISLSRLDSIDKKDYLCYRIRRIKFGDTYLFDEFDWDEHPNFGTAIPLKLLDEIPPVDKVELLQWLIDKELTYKDEVARTWDQNYFK